MKGFVVCAAGLWAASTVGFAAAASGHRPPHAAPLSQLPPAQALPGARAAYGGVPIDVTTYHYDNNRTGWNPSETDLTPASVASSKFGLLATLNVDGNVFAQPLVVTSLAIPGKGTHDVLVVATGHDSVYAYDADTYAPLWQVSLGTPQNSNDVGCGDVVPEYGVSSTPVILRSGAHGATMYVVAAVEPSPGVFHTYLHKLDVTTGLDLVPPVEISPSAKLANGQVLTFDPQNQWNRSSLAYNNGALYIAIGSHCDNNAYGTSGWLLSYDGSLNAQNAFHTIVTPHGYELASIWMTGFAPAIDSAGNVFVATGNGDDRTHSEDYGESVLKLAPSLSEPPLGRYTAADANALNNGDIDFGSGGVMLLPTLADQVAPPLAVAMGKEAVLYLMNQNDLGGLTATPKGAYSAIRLNGAYGGLWGGPAYYDGPAGPTIFTQVDSSPLRSLSVIDGVRPKLKVNPQSGGTSAGYGGSLPIVSSNGAAANTGVVWLIRRSNPVELEAYDAVKLGTPIFSANIGTWSNQSNQNPFLTPVEANGRVYAPGYLTVKVFGLTQ
jgi:hypothetical protein